MQWNPDVESPVWDAARESLLPGLKARTWEKVHTEIKKLWKCSMKSLPPDPSSFGRRILLIDARGAPSTASLFSLFSGSVRAWEEARWKHLWLSQSEDVDFGLLRFLASKSHPHAPRRLYKDWGVISKLEIDLFSKQLSMQDVEPALDAWQDHDEESARFDCWIIE